MDKESARKIISGLISKYENIVKENRSGFYNEEMTKKDLILPLFNALGWDTENSNEVTAEEKISKRRVDYGFRINGIPKFMLETKKIKEDIMNTKFVEQAIDYSWNKGCTWAVLTNFEKLIIFNAEWKVETPWHNRYKTFEFNEYLQRFDEFWLLSKESYEKRLIDLDAEKVGKKEKRVSVDKQLLYDFTRLRELLSKNITKLNQKKELSETELDECVQRILDRLIFIRNCEDRELEPRVLISNYREWSSGGKGQLIKSLRDTFIKFDKNYNSKIFAEHLCDNLEIDNDVLQEIIESLYYTKDKSISYDFSAIDADILGSIYEQYLSHILKKTDKRATITENNVRKKEQGIYYTPIYIVDYIVRTALEETLKNKNVDIDKIRVLDAACGSGSFLIKTFDILNEYHQLTDKNYAQTQLDLKTGTTFTRKVRILQNNIFGVDLDKQAVEISQLNLLLKIAEKGHRLPLLEQNIKCGNSLIDEKEIAGDKAFEWNEEFKDIMNEGGFDVVIGNPPYVKLQNLDKKQVEYFYSNYDTAKLHYDIYTLFVEKGYSLLKEGGILGFILPTKFMSTDYGAGLRKLISKNKSIMQVVSFKDFQVFTGATTYTCLLFLRKSKNKDFKYFEISDKNKLQQSRILSSDLFTQSLLKQPEDDSPWIFSTDNSKKLMEKLNKINLKLGDVSKDIFQGFLSGRDKFFFVQVIEEKQKEVKIRNVYTEKEHILEKSLIKKLLKGKEIKRWKIDWNNYYVIYPYLEYDNTTKLIPIEEMKSNYPKTYEYFQYYKKELMTSETTEAVDNENYYRFRRARSKEQFEQRKILTQVLASKNSFTMDEDGEYYFVGGGNAGGFGIILKEEYSKDYTVILSLLNSELLEFYLKKISTPFRGGFFSYGKKFIENFPLILPTGEIWEQLNDLSKKQLDYNRKLIFLADKKTDERNRIEENIKKIDSQIDDLVYEIYGITKDEKEIIQKILY